jgi:hypothetical protein
MDNKTLILGYKTEAKIRSEGGRKFITTAANKLQNPNFLKSTEHHNITNHINSL